MASNKQLSFRVPHELYERFTKKVVADGKQSGKVLQQLVKAYCEGNIPDGSSKVASDDEVVVVKKSEINQLVADEVVAVTAKLEARLGEIEAKLNEVESGSNKVEVSQIGNNSGDSNDEKRGSSEVGNDSTKVANGSEKVGSSQEKDGSDKVAVASSKDSQLQKLRDYLLKALNIDEQKSLAKEIAHELNCSYQRALNRIQDKPKKRLDAIDKTILKELEKYQENRYN